jgi:hypothetical protein
MEMSTRENSKNSNLFVEKVGLTQAEKLYAAISKDSEEET